MRPLAANTVADSPTPGLRERLRRGLSRLRGEPLRFDLEPYLPRIAAIDRLDAQFAGIPDRSLRGRSLRLRERAHRGEAIGHLEAEGFALVREASRRALRLDPFRVQRVAALALLDGRVVELPTGEGKTLAAVFPTYLRGLYGAGAHVLTFNDYLARRDAAWMGPVYRLLGLEVDFVQQGMERHRRRQAYRADVTYLTAREAGFDLLRDSLETEPSAIVQRPFHFALVDEADSVMIDEGRVPLVIAGGEGGEPGEAHRMAMLVRNLEAGVHFEIGEHGRSVDLTEAGLELVEQLLGCGDLLARANLERLTAVNCALHAAHLLRRDVDYVVKEGRTAMVDEFTGRIVDDRRWPDGLQTALDAKEGVALRPRGRVLGSIALQHLLRLYPLLCGMTGTARSAAAEIQELFGLEVVVVPPNRPCIRRDLPDRVYSTRQARDRAVVEEIRMHRERGRPVLVGTASVDESETLAAGLERAGIPCEVLNARHDEWEARLIGRAGAPGAVTISTNMAGRGADIRLGGEDEAERDAVVRLGGLHVIGTHRHEALRIDRQLRGRAGRQGDPGSSQFFVSLDDDLLIRYGIRSLVPAALWPRNDGEALDDPLIRHEVARAQRIVEGQNGELRRTLTRYSEVIERQRRDLAARRIETLQGRAVSPLARARPELRAAIAHRVGERALREAEREVSLRHIDRAWSEHLEAMADLREGIHLVRVGGRDPLHEFVEASSRAFREMLASIDERILDSLCGADWRRPGSCPRPPGSGSTWTYVVNDDPFRDQLGIQLTGNAGLAAAAALYAGPILVLWGLWNRFLRRRPPSDR